MSQLTEQLNGFFDYMNGSVDKALVQDIIDQLGGSEAFIGAMHDISRGLSECHIVNDKAMYGNDDKALALYKAHHEAINQSFRDMVSLIEPVSAVMNMHYFAGADCGISSEDMLDMASGGEIAADDRRAVVATRFVLHYIAKGYYYFYQRQVDYSIYGDPNDPDFELDED